MRTKPVPTLLCLDDEPRDLELQRCAFEGYGFRVFTVQNLSEALDVLHHNRIDLVVLDYRLLHASSVDVAVEIRKFSPRMPIVLLSGYLYDIPEYFKRAVDGYLSKDELPEAWIAELLRHVEPGLSANA